MVTKFTGGLLENTHIAKQFSQDVVTTSGLTFGMRGGFMSLGSTVTEIAASTTLLTDDLTNYIYIDISGTPVIAVDILLPEDDALMLFTIVTVSGEITTIDSWRTRLTSLNSTSV